jgi:hypothetical protein
MKTIREWSRQAEGVTAGRTEYPVPSTEEPPTSLGYRLLNTRYVTGLVLAIASFFVADPAQAGPTHAYKAARIWTGNGPPVANGVLLVRDGKILAVGPRAKIPVPDDAEVHDLGLSRPNPGAGDRRDDAR